MSSWGNNDNAANTPVWAATSIKLAPTRTNVTSLFDNETADAFIPGQTVGLFGVDAQEALATHAQHTGWNLRTTGSGGRAGRVTNEVLVALSTMSGDSDGQTYANVSITLVGPSSASIVSETAYANVVTFVVSPQLVGNTSATLTYQWQYNNAAGTTGWTNIPANTTPIQWNGRTSDTLYARPKTTANTGTVLRVVVTAADQGVIATSANAVITVT